MQRYFIDKSFSGEKEVILLGDHFHHIARVMRMSPGNEIFIVFRNEKACIAKIVDITNDEIITSIVKWEEMKKELPVHVTIASGLPKGDKLELIIQKGTELGAFQFLPFIADRSIVKWDAKKEKKKLDRWLKIAEEAAEQSHRQHKPNILAPVSFKELLSISSNYIHKIVAYEENAKQGESANFAKMLANFQEGDTVLIVFGPEGGISNQEIEQLKNNGFEICGFGPRILRTETAPLYALSAISYHLELMR
ncbi:16S rRNA (uracil(1498)-N(3))-methyltransferase [Bacillus sp. FJAT-49736]|uniref:16S rRNA (uracil(1498)-N(3))-methyltransferase n=1 Tax=Bacillus sp. FJAT-49736 TaxID=2833582 RepID=UPI001BC9B62A|nr:16S rRNA (uracil(1498)-N(3))-methyltransferase [Bacillus sp. FJAT-49736]